MKRGRYDAYPTDEIQEWKHQQEEIRYINEIKFGIPQKKSRKKRLKNKKL